VVLDVFSGRVVGRSIDCRQETCLVTKRTRHGAQQPGTNRISGDPQRSGDPEFILWAFTQRVINARFPASMGSVGDC
jgi:hypothetical protein